MSVSYGFSIFSIFLTFYYNPSFDKSEICGGWTQQFTQMKFYNVKYKTVHRWDWDFIYHDLDGSTTGLPNSVIVYKDNITQNRPYCRADSSYINGTVCAYTTGWIRFAFKELNPNSVILVNYSDTQHQMASIPYKAKRLTHKPGFMSALEANQSYTFTLDEAPFPTNLSYTSGFYAILPGQWLIISHQLLRKPDRVSFGAFNAIESFTPLTSTSPCGSYYYDNSTGHLSYMISNGANVSPFIDYDISFSAIKCRYLYCIEPTQPADRLPIKSRPSNAFFWSNIDTWYVAQASSSKKKRQTAGVSLPQDYDDILIPENVYVVVDTDLPKIRRLQIDGYLELDNERDHDLAADIIFINGGQLIIGWESNPILKNVNIRLTGYKDSLNYLLPDGYSNIGGKGKKIHKKT